MSLKSKAKKAAPKKKAPAKTRKPKYAKVRTEVFPIDDINDAPYNARSITNDALSGLAQSMADFGVLSMPVVNVRDGINRLVGGHQRVRVLREKGATEVQCIVVEFDQVTEQRANLALNNRAIQGEFVPEMTRDLLDQIRGALGGAADPAFRSLRFDSLLKSVTRSLSTVAGVDDVVQPGKTEDDAIPGLSRKKAVSESGCFYQLGDHVVFCGKLEAPGTLMGFPVDMADAAVCQFTGSNIKTEKGINIYLQHVLANTVGALHLVCDHVTHVDVQWHLQNNDGHYSSTIVAYDPAFKAKKSAPYACNDIPIIYGWPEGVARPWFGARDQGNVWPLRGKPPKDDVPVEVLVKALQNTTKAGDTVLDCNVRKGATVIAAQKTGRKLIGYCMHPREMDAIRARWTHFVLGSNANWQAATKEIA